MALKDRLTGAVDKVAGFLAGRKERGHIDADEAKALVIQGIKIGAYWARVQADGAVTPLEWAGLTRKLAAMGIDIHEALED